MKQILFVCAGNEFPRGAFNFLLSMQQHEPVNVLGLFFRPIDVEAMTTASQFSIQAPFDRMVERELEVVNANKALFALQCTRHSIQHQIHGNEGQWEKQVFVKESRFADLVLLSGELFYADIIARQPNIYLHEALHSAECPTVVVPENFSKCSHVFIAYDGSKESVFAMKQFNFLFPYHADLPADIVYIREENSNGIPDVESLREYARLYFKRLNVSRGHFRAARYFAVWLGKEQQPMLISGSYGRSSFSYLRKRSFSEQVIREHKFPVFIAHV